MNCKNDPFQINVRFELTRTVKIPIIELYMILPRQGRGKQHPARRPKSWLHRTTGFLGSACLIQMAGSRQSPKLCFREKHVSSNPGVIFYKLKLLWQRTRVLAFDIEEACSGCTDKLDKEGCALLRCHRLAARLKYTQVSSASGRSDSHRQLSGETLSCT